MSTVLHTEKHTMSDELDFTGGDVRVPCYNDDEAEPHLHERLSRAATIDEFNAVIAEHVDDQLALARTVWPDVFMLLDGRLDPRPYVGGDAPKLARGADGRFELRATDGAALDLPVALTIRHADERRAVALAGLFLLGLGWAARREAFDQDMRWGGGRRRHAEKMANEGI